MSELHFSDNARLAARMAFEAPDNEGHGILNLALDAALAHDAERLARQIIEGRVAGISDEWCEGIRRAGKSPAAVRDMVRAALLRALTEQP